jgi:hypothetical protein
MNTLIYRHSASGAVARVDVLSPDRLEVEIRRGDQAWLVWSEPWRLTTTLYAVHHLMRRRYHWPGEPNLGRWVLQRRRAAA